MENFLNSEIAKQITIIGKPYIFAVLIYLVSSLAVFFSGNRIYKKIILFITPVITGILLFYPEYRAINLSGRYFTLTDMFIQILLISGLSISFLNEEKKRRFHSLTFLMTAASIASITTVNLIQCFFFYFFICYIPFFTIVDLGRNFKKYSAFLVISLISDLFIIAGVSFFTGSDNFIIKDSIRPYIIYPLLIKASVFPFHFLIQNLIRKFEFDLFIFYSFNIFLITIYFIIEKFAGTDILITAGYITALYTLLYSIVQNDIRYISNLIMIACMNLIICIAGFFSDLFSFYGLIISFFTGSLLLMFTLSEISKIKESFNLKDIKGIFQNYPVYFLSVIIAFIILTGIPFVSYYNEIQLLVEKFSTEIFWKKILIYLPVSLIVISLFRIMYFLFREDESFHENEEKKGHFLFPFILLSSFYIVLKVFYFTDLKVNLIILSDYFQIVLSSVAVFMVLRNSLSPKKGKYFSIADITEFVTDFNNRFVNPVFQKSEEIFGTIYNIHPKLNTKFIRYFEIFEKQISEKIRDVNISIGKFSSDLQRLEQMRTKLYLGIAIIITSFIIVLLVVL